MGVLAASVAIAVAVGLAGCAAPSPPPLPTEPAIRADYQVLLDGSWERLGLPPSTPRPGFVTPELVGSQTWWTEYQGCLNTIQPKHVFTEVGDDWYGVLNSNPDVLTVGEQIVFYRCLTRFVDADFGVIRLLTVEHLEYLWRHYERWSIPCITHAGFEVGFTVTNPPSYEAFVASHSRGSLWSPYDSLSFVATAEAMEQTADNYERLIDRCGDRYDALNREHGILARRW